ncbi:MAG: integrase core domain-containing protein [Congregibacter sp.]
MPGRKPGNPQQNGRHERMHLTLKKEATKPASFNFLQQQGRFDDFIEGYNQDRPHPALAGQYPAEVYTPSAREYFHPEPAEYPFHDRAIQVTQSGRICRGRRKVNFSTVFAGQYVGIREIADEIWLVSFMDYDLGFFDQTENRVVTVGHNPFAPLTR